MRLIAVLLLVVAAFCVYGGIAATEPGTPAAWRLGYGAGAVVTGLAGLWLLRGRGEG